MTNAPIGRSETGDPLLLTPGPLTTSKTTKQAMIHDWGSRDATFLAANASMLKRIAALAGRADSHVTVPVQGSGTFAVEAMVTSMVPKGGKLLLAINGAYGLRARRMAEIAGRAVASLEFPEDRPVDPAAVDAALAADAAITHVFVVHCETTSGVLNPVDAVSDVVARRGRRLLVDAMSAFGAIGLAATTKYDALAASSNKCIEGVPGLGFVVCDKAAIVAAKGNATTLTLDLHDQWAGFEKTGQWRFTPPVHAIMAFSQALDEHAAEGGVEGRGGRYRRNCKVLVEGLRAMGFQTLLPDTLQAPIIVTVHMPSDPKFVFQKFYDRLKEQGYVIYPGKLTVADSFRIGCIGRLDESHMRGALAAIKATLAEMGVASGAPARKAA
ncbi:MAG: 2-aminoethylphosphonate--pyruvate transaminase [Rhodospirillales bacterium]|nr:2-aminoethylphosphonate--pyruvate transaminase [Rhodospirillales bacterium]